MARLNRKIVGGTTFACYSERGIVAYFMLRVLPHDPLGFLRQIENGAGDKPFASLQPGAIGNLTIFSELVFGSKHGFGNPDGALYFTVDGQPRLVFYEAKLNEKYLKSCEGKAYNSTIQGQLELKWRLLALVQQGAFQTIKNKKYVVESQAFASEYPKDKFYSPSAKKKSGYAAFRHLRFHGGVETILTNYIPATAEQVYFLTSTNDDTNPFVGTSIPADKRPHCVGKTWDQVKGQFCWISNTVIENCPAL